MFTDRHSRLASCNAGEHGCARATACTHAAKERMRLTASHLESKFATTAFLLVSPLWPLYFSFHVPALIEYLSFWATKTGCSKMRSHSARNSLVDLSSADRAAACRRTIGCSNVAETRRRLTQNQSR